AQAEVVHNDDTSMRVLSLDRDTDISPERTGVFTSGLVWILQKLRIALYFTGCKHAGENLAEELKLRSPDLPPIIQMCDALSRNAPKIIDTLVPNCNAQGRRNYAKVTANFPEPCRYVLEAMGVLSGYDAVAQMGDQFMSLIHTCELNDVNAFDYLTELLRHAEELKQNPSGWMPWNYRETLARLARPAAA